ncbi:NAD-dependent epimerase/dehydratase family protein [Pelotomaculum isophthalicicum JI]|uniref:NAD-dependent epimerase/dehydratase family protein n=1 Tax=Pelotomaculum isophthalicicum JI TaxID=947010 RepID=A0A9X4JWI1_9FIRM|nr:NAD-dependent epimerase/dehydratase family protein [Pelotomaculum isophthalicicum]MDF9409148.1 NAD-dependent epimerase/dehydratase family protein [Pelotomaculum isophthalicicum JI]
MKPSVKQFGFRILLVKQLNLESGGYMNIIVTGSAGFIGSQLTEKFLVDGHKVTGIDAFRDYYPKKIKLKNLRKSTTYPLFTFIEKDLTMIPNPELIDLLTSADVVVHLAAQAGVRASWGANFDIYLRDNILATQKLLEAAKGCNLKKFIYASSSSIYGNINTFPVSEDTLPNPFSPYGVTKLAGEKMCLLYWLNYGVPVVCLRYFTVYGPRQRPDMGIYKFIKSLLNDNQIIVYGDGNQTRDFTYVDDILQANYLAIQGLSGNIYNIGGSQQVTVNELIFLLERFIGKRAKIKYTEKQKGDVNSTSADITKARQELGYKPLTDIEKGLNAQIRWMQEGV